jgi:hypothetical protein
MEVKAFVVSAHTHKVQLQGSVTETKRNRGLGDGFERSQNGRTIRNITVTRKPRPHPKATNLRFVFPILNLPEYSGSEMRSSEVISSIIAVQASHRLMSDSVNGKLISI